jgi:hypothetical protein
MVGIIPVFHIPNTTCNIAHSQAGATCSSMRIIAKMSKRQRSDSATNLDLNLSAKSVSLLFYTVSEDELKKEPKHGNGCNWVCFCGSSRAKTGSGYSNLFSHVKDSHPKYELIFEQVVKAGWKGERNSGKKFLEAISQKEEELERMGLKHRGKLHKQTSLQLLTPEKAVNIWKWIQWIVVKLLPFSFVECAYTRENSCLGPISRKTLVKYINLTAAEVERKISNVIPDSFAIVYDAWTTRSQHFVGTFVTFDTKCILIGFTLMDMDEDDDEPSFDAFKFMQVISGQLAFYSKDWTNVVCVIGDNCSVNKKLADLVKKPMIGCHSHRFNIGVNAFLAPYEGLLSKLDAIMARLRTLKEAAKLRSKTDYSAVLRNATRWSSTYSMVKRYMIISAFIDVADVDLADVLLSPAEQLQVSNLLEHLKDLNSVTLKLQVQGFTMSEARLALDMIIQDFPLLADYVGTDARIVKDPDFERGVIKIQRRQEGQLTTEEREAVKCLLRPVHEVPPEETLQVESDDDSFSVRLQTELKKLKRECEDSFQSAYVDTRFLYPVSNDVERLFSQAGRAYDELRGQLEQSNLESILFLKYNQDFWDAKTVHSAWLNRKSEDDE